MPTTDDLEMLGFLSRYGYAAYHQLATHFGINERSVRRKAARMIKLGLAERWEWLRGYGVVLIPTRAGVALSGLDLPQPTFNHGTVEHELVVVTVGSRLERSGEKVVTAREIRAGLVPGRRVTPQVRAAMREAGVPAAVRPAFAYYYGHEAMARVQRDLLTRINDGDISAARQYREMTSQSGMRQQHTKAWHIPDLVVAKSKEDMRPRSVAIEVELRAKSAERWKTILNAYSDRGTTDLGNAAAVSQVHFMVPDNELGRAVSNVAKHLSLPYEVTTALLSEEALPRNRS